MKTHQVHEQAVTPDDLTEDQRDVIVETVSRLFDAESGVRFTESPNSTLELVTPDRIPTHDRTIVRNAVEEQLEYSLDSFETVVLDQRISWPTVKYELCIGFE